MKNLAKIRSFGITAILLISIGDILFSVYIKDFVEYMVVAWIFNFVVFSTFHLSTKHSEQKAKHDKYKDWADKLNQGE
ncbi:hypothetical protein [Leuconostoc falkenbergense]|uniref:hypothetical protein n=1 Tax=Leuconostoc falkenbergense TaxID=2766470 RepID=UPI0039EA340E